MARFGLNLVVAFFLSTFAQFSMPLAGPRLIMVPAEKVEPQVSGYEVHATSYIQKSSTIDAAQSIKIAKAVHDAATEFAVDPLLLLALIRVESNFDQDAVGSGGSSKGLVQVIPYWHREKIKEGRQRFKVYSVFDLQLNTWLGAKILRTYLDRSKDVRTALIRYNASDHATQYAQKVLAEYGKLRRSQETAQT